MCEEAAYHEAGHAYVAHLLGGHVHSLSIDPDRDDGPRRSGDVTIHWPRQQWSEVEWHKRAISVALAGPVAEMIHRQERFHPAIPAEWSQDWKTAWELAARLVPSESDRMRFLEGVVRHLEQLLSQEVHWYRLATLVDNLLAHEILDAEQIAETFESL